MNFTKDNGEIVDEAYVRRRVSAYLSKFRRIYSLAERRTAIAETLDDPKWMMARSGYTVGAICRAVSDRI